jgi:hypothetical protein
MIVFRGGKVLSQSRAARQGAAMSSSAWEALERARKSFR